MFAYEYRYDSCMSQISSVRSNLGDDDFLWGEGCDEDAR